MDHPQEYLDGLIMIRDCMQLLRTAINRKHWIADNPLFICALCWKRVRFYDKVDKKKDVAMPRKDSTYYCPSHLPKRSEHLYRKDRTALFSAMKSKKNPYLEELNVYEEKPYGRISSSQYLWLNSLTAKPLELFYSIATVEPSEPSWQINANCLLKYASDMFPQAFEKVNRIDAFDYADQDKWLVDGVVWALDDTKNKDDVSFWKKDRGWRRELMSFIDENKREITIYGLIDNPSSQLYEFSECDEFFILASLVLSRYEAFKNKSSSMIAPSMYKWLGSFSKRPSILFHSLESDNVHNNDWCYKANYLVSGMSNIYPITYQLIKAIDAQNYTNSADWLIDGVVAALDGSKNKDEVAFWWKAEKQRTKQSIFDNVDHRLGFLSDDDEYFRLMCVIVRRYEAYQVIKNTKQPRGGGASKDYEKRANLTTLLATIVKPNGQPDIKAIAHKLDISPSRVYKLKGEIERESNTTK
jgi:hypothetical protein